MNRINAAIIIILLSLPFRTIYPSSKPPIPESLDHIFIKTYPNNRIICPEDISREDMKDYFHNKLPHYPGVLEGDYDADGQMDIMLMTYNNRSKELVLIAAMRRKDKWSLEHVTSWRVNNPGHYYIELLEPGLYQSCYDLPISAKDKKKGYVKQYQSAAQGVLLNPIEGEGMACFRTNNGWILIA